MVPLVINKLSHSFGLENFSLGRGAHRLHKIWLITVFVGHHGQTIYRVLNFDNLAEVIIFLFRKHSILLPQLMENIGIFASDFEDAIIVWLHNFWVIGVNVWPFILVKLKIVADDVAVQNIFELNFLFKKENKVVLEQEWVDVAVLVRNDVFYY